MESKNFSHLRTNFLIFCILSGYICCQELRRVLTEQGDMKLTPEEVQEMIDMVDVNDDKKIQFSEFVTLFMGELEE